MFLFWVHKYLQVLHPLAELIPLSLSSALLDAFELWCWRRLSRVPWTSRRSNRSTPKGINTEYSLKGLVLKLILWPHDANNWLLRKDLDAGKDWGQEEKEMQGWDGWIASPTRWTWVWAGSGSWWWTGRPGTLQSMSLQRVRHYWATELTDRAGLLWVRPGYLCPILRYRHLLWSPGLLFLFLPDHHALRSQTVLPKMQIWQCQTHSSYPCHNHAELWPISVL